MFNMINNTDSLYSFTIPVQFPKTGTQNSAARVGVVSASGGATVWCDVPGDQRDNYIPRMEWSGNGDEVAIQRMNRHQNTNQVMLCAAATGQTRTILTETDPAYLDAVNDWEWLDGDKEFTWVSERSGWRHLYRVSRDGKNIRAVTDDEDALVDGGLERSKQLTGKNAADFVDWKFFKDYGDDGVFAVRLEQVAFGDIDGDGKGDVEHARSQECCHGNGQNEARERVDAVHYQREGLIDCAAKETGHQTDADAQ